MKLADKIEYADGQIAKEEIARTDSGSSVLMAFDKGVALGTHSSPAIAIVQILEGTCSFTVNGVNQTLNAGDYIVMQPGTPHSLGAVERFKMLLTRLNA